MLDTGQAVRMLDTGPVICCVILIACLLDGATAQDQVCQGVVCLNGGTFEYSDEHCVCSCQPGYGGILCEMELLESNWPDGPYALLMPPAGCPESANHGWARGFIHVAMATPVNLWRYGAEYSEDDNVTADAVTPGKGVNLEGIFSSAVVRLDFCFKKKTDNTDRSWPDGNYGIFGTSDGCPEDFTEEMYSYSFPAIRAWSKDGHLPYFEINTSKGELLVKLCRRTADTPTYSDMLGTFVVLKNPDVDCDPSSDAYDVLEESLVFLDTNKDVDKAKITNMLDFCHFWKIPDTFSSCAGSNFHCGRGQCIASPQVCDGTAQCVNGEDETDDECAKKCGPKEFHCGLGVCIPKTKMCESPWYLTYDCADGRDELNSNCHLKCDRDALLCDTRVCMAAYRLCDGFDDCWDGADEQPWNCGSDDDECYEGELKCPAEGRCVKSTECGHTDHCMATGTNTEARFFCEDQFGTDGYFYCGEGVCISDNQLCDGQPQCADGSDEVTSNCHRKCQDSSSGNFYCPYAGCIPYEHVCTDLAKCGETPDSGGSMSCMYELGLTDETIFDPQITASSSKPDHEPPHVRLTLNSWCPEDNDDQPFLQIDFLMSVLVEALVIHNRIHIQGDMDGVQYSDTVFPLGTRIFSVSYAMFPDAFQMYTDQPLLVDYASNYSQPHTFHFMRPFLARLLRVHLLSPIQGGDLCLQLEVLGCRGKGHYTNDCAFNETNVIIMMPWLPDVPDAWLWSIVSPDQCLIDCVTQTEFDKCFSAEFADSAYCLGYGRQEYIRYETFDSDENYYRLCSTDEAVDFRSSDAAVSYQHIEADSSRLLSSFEYPLPYRAGVLYLWKIDSVNKHFVRITFGDIYLHDPSTDESGTCDVLTIYHKAGADPLTLNSTYNMRYPTIPTERTSLHVTFNPCNRPAKDYGLARGFLMLLDFDPSVTLLDGNIAHLPTTFYTYSLLGLDVAPQTWYHAEGMWSTITFHYFHVPCNPEFVFTIDGVAYCNAMRPLEDLKGFKMKIEYKFTGDPADLSTTSPEGFSATISQLQNYLKKNPVKIMHDGSRLTLMGDSDFKIQCTDGTRVAISAVCDGVQDCADGSDETCDVLSSERVHTELNGETLEGMEICSEELHKCFAYFDPPGERHTWTETNTLCHTAGYTLPNVHSSAEMNLIRTWMYALHMEKGDIKQRQVFYAYIGLMRYNRDGWVDEVLQDGSSVSFTAWDTNEPTNGFLRLCTEMGLGMLSEKLTWRSRPCDEVLEETHDHYHGTICERRYNTTMQGPVSILSDINDLSITPTPEAVNKLHRCQTGEWISRHVICDGVPDCSDASDEMACETGTNGACSEDEFRCTDGECINLDKVCDHKADCAPDGNDEFCTFPACEADEFRCRNQRCIPLTQQCDSYMDCEDNSDEINCFECNTNTSFMCTDLTCIHKFKVCDSYANCVDGRDEEACGQTYATCYDLWVDQGFATNTLIKISDDQTVECQFEFAGSGRVRVISIIEGDLYTLEANNLHGDNCTQESQKKCTETERYLAMYYGWSDWECNEHLTYDEPVKCESEYEISDIRGCHDGSTMQGGQKCLYDKGRAGYTEGCRNFKHLQYCDDFECPANYVKCPGSFCLERSFLCDGDRQCPGGEDEIGCQCKSGNDALAIVYEGLATEGVRSHIFRLARQFYSPNRQIQLISYTVLQHAPANYSLTARPPHPFRENLNTAEEIEIESDDDNLAINITSLFINSDPTHVIVIEDNVDTIMQLPPVLLGSGASIGRVYRVQVDEHMKQHTKAHTSDVGGETIITLDRWSRLSFSGASLFPGLCQDASLRNCSGQYRCSSSLICLPLNQVCDGISQCPFADDEETCDFSCPEMCSCSQQYSVECNHGNLSITDMESIPDTARKLDISSNVMTLSVEPYFNQSFPRLVRFIASKCDIMTIPDDFFITKMMHLTYLDLSHNKLSKISIRTFDGLIFLQHLNLNGNTKLEVIEPHSFRSLQSLMYLYITQTKVSEILPDTFTGLDIYELDISDNEISKLYKNAFNGLSAAVIKIQGNDMKDVDTDTFTGISGVQKLEAPSFSFCCYMSSSSSDDGCYPRQDAVSSCDDLVKNSALQALLWIVGVLALVGNLCVIVYRVYYDRERLKTGFGMFVTNLAVSDFIMGVYLMIIAVADVNYRNKYYTVADEWMNSGVCNIAGILATVSSEASVFFLCLLTLDRILVVKCRFGKFKFDMKKACLAIVICWVLALLLGLIPVLIKAGFDGSFYSATGVCMALPLDSQKPAGYAYSFIVFAVLNFIMFILIAVGQVLIYLETSKTSNSVTMVSAARWKELTIARNLLLVMCTDFLCWFPIGIMGMVANDGHEISGEAYAWTTVFLLTVNSALNPFLYTLSAVIAKKSLSPGMEEKRKSTHATDSTKKMMKIWSSGAIVALQPGDYQRLTDAVTSGVSMTTSDLLNVAHAVVRSVFYLHDVDHVHGELTDGCIYMHAQDKGKVAVRGCPTIARNSEEKAKDINDYGQVVRYLLQSTKNA